MDEQDLQNQELTGQEQQNKKNRKLLFFLIAGVVLIGGSVLAYLGVTYNDNIKDKSTNGENIQDSVSAENEAVVYRRAAEGGYKYDVVISNLDGSGKRTIVDDVIVDLILIPETANAIIVNHDETRIDLLSLVDNRSRPLFIGSEHGVGNIGEGLSNNGYVVLSPDNTNIVFPVGDIEGVKFFDHSKIVKVDITSSNASPDFIFDGEEGLVLDAVDSNNEIYLRKHCHCDAPQPDSTFTINMEGEYVRKATLEEAKAAERKPELGGHNIVAASQGTSQENAEDKKLIIDGVVIDILDPLPWSFGPAAFDVVGFIKY